jgi:hypothetical protein
MNLYTIQGFQLDDWYLMNWYLEIQNKKEIQWATFHNQSLN